MKKLLLLLSALLIQSPHHLHADSIPPPPEPGNYLHDYASMVTTNDRERITNLQDSAYNNNSVPIVVITIDKASNYHQASSVKSLARQWFNEWEIGTMQRTDGEQKNAGILLLIARQDRKARIELGADWGHRWNSKTDQIMSRNIVANFKKGEFSRGIYRATQALSEMAAMDPGKRIVTYSPAPRPKQTARPAAIASTETKTIVREDSYLTQWSWFSREITYTIIGLGALIAYIGIFALKNYQTATIITGLSLVGFAMVPIAVLVIWAIYLLNKIGAFDNYEYSSSNDSSWGWSSGSSFSDDDSSTTSFNSFSSSWSSDDSDSGGWSGGGGSDGEW